MQSILIPPHSVQYLLFYIFVLIFIFCNIQANGIKWYLIVLSISISLMTSDLSTISCI